MGLREAKKLIRDAEADKTKRKYHHEWADTYAKAAEEYMIAGKATEAQEASWMYYLMRLVTVIKEDRDINEKRWFAPLAIFTDGTKHPDPDAVTDDMLDYYQHQATTLNNPLIASRCCDIIWERRKDYGFASMSVQAHLSCINIYRRQKDWVEVRKHLSRAIELTNATNNQSEILVKLKQLWKRILLQNLKPGAKNYAHKMVRLEGQLGNLVNIKERRLIAKRCQAIAEYYNQQCDYGAERNWLQDAIHLYKNIRDNKHKTMCELLIARSFCNQGKMHLDADSGLMSVHFLQDARAKYHELGCSEEADEIANLLKKAHPIAMQDMKEIRTPINISGESLDQIDQLRQLSLPEGLKAVF